MKIIDCFIYSDEDLLLDVRLNILDKYVDKFVVVEACYKHNGDKKEKNFNIKKFSKFSKKIDYIFLDKEPSGLYKVDKKDNNDQAGSKLVKNAIILEHYQRNQISRGLKKVHDDDLILISDLDEIPKLEGLNFNKFKKKLVYFKHKMFYYKFNLYYKELPWIGTKGCLKKNLMSPQWLRDTKNKKYPFFRIDTFFSNKKYIDIDIIEDGGWHFTQLKLYEELFNKLNTFAHHVDFKESGLNLDDVKSALNEKRVLYDHFIDQKSQNKWKSNKILEKVNLNELPEYLRNNFDKLNMWFD